MKWVQVNVCIMRGRSKWDKVFKNGASKICGRQPLKNFTCSIREYFDSNVVLWNEKNKTKER